MEYSFTNVWGQSWALYKKSWLMLTVGVVIYCAANIPTWAVNATQSYAQGGDPKPEHVPAVAALLGGLACFSVLWAIFVVVPITGGMYWMGTRAARGQTPQLRDILQGYRRFPSLIGTLVVLCFVLLIPILLAAAVNAAILYFGVGFEAFNDGVQRADFDDCSRAAVACGTAWAFICLIVMYWMAIRLLFVWLIVTDESLGSVGPMRAMELSWRMTSGKALSLLGLFITTGVMAAATFCCCVLPLIFVGVPLALTQYGVAYNMLLNRDALNNQPTPAAS